MQATADTPGWIFVSKDATLSDLTGDTINSDNSRTSNIGTAITGSGTISMNAGSGQVTIAADKLTEFTGELLIESGRFNEIANGHVFSKVTVNDGGQFYINNGYNYTGDVSISGTGWNDSSDEARDGALSIGVDSTLSGKLTLTGDAAVQIYGADNKGTIAGNVSGEYVLTKKGGGTLLLSGPSIDLKGITVSEGSLYLGGDHNNKNTVTEVTAVALDSLTIQQGKSVTANYMKGTIESVELAGGTFNYRDCYTKDDANALNITTMTVSADSTFTRTWKGIVNVSELTGSGNIAISNINTQSSTDVVNLNVTTLKDYTGTISSSTDKVALKISSVNQGTSNKSPKNNLIPRKGLILSTK